MRKRHPTQAKSERKRDRENSSSEEHELYLAGKAVETRARECAVSGPIISRVVLSDSGATLSKMRERHSETRTKDLVPSWKFGAYNLLKRDTHSGGSFQVWFLLELIRAAPPAGTDLEVPA
jgi:hypothetical protein